MQSLLLSGGYYLEMGVGANHGLTEQTNSFSS